MSQLPLKISSVSTVIPDLEDHALILAASWEERCLGVASRLQTYRCQEVLMTVYDGKSEKRQNNIDHLVQLLPTAGKLREIPAKHENPLENVRSVIEHVRKLSQNGVARLTIDISSFTRKHFLQLLLGLDLSGMLESCQYLYTEPKDYHTQVDDPISSGITSVRAIDAFAGRLHSSRDTVLILFLGYEGARARALWEHLEPHVTYAVIPDPPMQPSWKGRTEAQNRYILSCLPSENVLKSSALQPADTEELLESLATGTRNPIGTYNYILAPMGTKPQTLGVYRFLRKNPNLATVMYASPSEYKQVSYPPGPTWLLDRSDSWQPTS